MTKSLAFANKNIMGFQILLLIARTQNYAY